MKATAENFVKCLTTLVNLYRNNGKEIKFEHFTDDGQIGIFTEPTNAIVNDVRMVAEQFLMDANSVVHVDYGWGFIEIFYCDTHFKKSADTATLKLIGAL